MRTLPKVERDSGSVALAVAALAATALVGLLVLAAGSMSAARQRAVRAADFAALAAASRVISDPGSACTAALPVGRANGAAVVGCGLGPALANGLPTVRVDVEAPPAPFIVETLALVGVTPPRLRAAARAGLATGEG